MVGRFSRVAAGKLNSVALMWLARLIPIVAFVLYALWLIGPYLHSTVARNATVTAWSHLASAPIFGTVEYVDIIVNARVPADGIIGSVTNHLASRAQLEEAQLQVRAAQDRFSSAQQYLRSVLHLVEERNLLREQYAELQISRLETSGRNWQQALTGRQRQLALLVQQRERTEQLQRRQLAAEQLLDEQNMAIAELEAVIAGLQRNLDDLQLRLEGAGRGQFLASDGAVPEWLDVTDFSLDLELQRARQQAGEAQIIVEEASGIETAAADDYARRRQAEVRVRPNSTFWRELISSGTNVSAGQTVAEWIDCDDLLVDVPVSDAAVSLIRPGQQAEVILEGEKQMRLASVLLTRGAGGTLGREDIAALAKSRNDEDVAQVLLSLPSQQGEFAECPVGLAAHVYFPHVGIIDIVRARLRL
ncbi:MAG: HlyD family efflux transporter periplasmic adaptor subunit [Pseudomonadota bacterium]